jgi:hypothetical protein
MRKAVSCPVVKEGSSHPFFSSLSCPTAKRPTPRPTIPNLILWFANTSAETQNAAVLGGVGVNTIVASIQHEDSGGQEPECA